MLRRHIVASLVFLLILYFTYVIFVDTIDVSQQLPNVLKKKSDR